MLRRTGVRLKLLQVAGAISLLLATEAEAKNTLQANVELSEWTPSQTVALDLDSGEYEVTPPGSDWPDKWPIPVKRSGRLDSEALALLKAMSVRAASEGLEMKECPKFPYYAPSNAVGPRRLEIVLGKTTYVSETSECRTKASQRVFNYVNQLFVRQMPSR